MSVIKVSHLYKSYGDLKAVEDFGFEVEEAMCYGLLGPNGAGKTTTMKVIYGKSEADNNKDTEISVFGMNPKTKMLEIKALTGIVPQQDNLDTELSVRDNLMVYSKFYGMDKKSAEKRIDELLDFMELTEKKKESVRSLSGGMQRRLTIARALLNNPRLLILDEPTTGLDPQVRHLIWNKLRELKQNKVTIILTTHYMEEAFQICDKISIMDGGKKLLEGEPRELLAKNIERYVMEIPGKCKIDSECELYFRDKDVRYEIHNDTMFAFSENIEIFSKYGEKIGSSNHYIRHSNLEDLFLKVTGRRLNENQ